MNSRTDTLRIRVARYNPAGQLVQESAVRRDGNLRTPLRCDVGDHLVYLMPGGGTIEALDGPLEVPATFMRVPPQ